MGAVVATENELQGEVARVVFSAAESGFTVVRVQVAGRRDPVTVVGRMAGVREGETIKVRGRWKRDPKFGEQLEVEGWEAVLPATTEGIRRYLGSGLVYGIGPKLAARIVDVFGEKTLDVLDADPSRLAEVRGIGREKVASLAKSWKEQREIRSVMVFLQGQGISPAYALRIYRRFGGGAARVLQENPYRLADEVSGIGFKTADAIARRLGIPEDSPARADAAVRYVLREASSDGHCFLPPEEIERRSLDVLAPKASPGDAPAKPPEARIVRDAAERLIAAGELIREETAVFPRALHDDEREVAARLRALLAATPRVAKPLDVPKALTWVEEKTGRTLASGQCEAVAKAAGGKVTVITGGPGTGKTTVVDAICRVAQARGERLLLAAPTGRAAKRLAEATGREAKTVHRLLEWDPTGGGFKRSRALPLEADLVILDECSMVDLPLMRSLLLALPDAARLVMVGDADQLPSVGPGNVLHDVIASRVVPTARLTEIFRQAAQSAIVSNAHRINAGEEPLFETVSRGFAPGPPPGGGAARLPDSDCFFVARDDPEEAVATIAELVAERIPKKWNLDPRRDVQVLAPMNRGAIGTQALNAALQARLNPHGRDVPGPRRLRVGDRVIQLRNDYDKEVFNGDLGRVVRWDEETTSLEVEIDGRAVVYPTAELDQLALAYASTIHRSQGSEYPAVVIPLLTQHYVMLQRNLLYTAVTRGKKLVVIVGSRRAVGMAVRNASGGARFTRLAERLIAR